MNQLRSKYERTLIGYLLMSLTVGLTGCAGLGFTSPEKQLQGIWHYTDDVQYEFQPEGAGCLHLETVDFEYIYQIKDHQLTLDFKDESVQDCVYEFEVKDDSLKLVGGEGTVGGEYELQRIAAE